MWINKQQMTTYWPPSSASARRLQKLCNAADVNWQQFHLKRISHSNIGNNEKQIY